MSDVSRQNAPAVSTSRSRLDLVLDALLSASCASWAVLGLLHEEGPPLLARIGAALVNATVAVLFAVRGPALAQTSARDLFRALPSMLLAAGAWRWSGTAWPSPLPEAFLAACALTALALAWLGASFAVLPSRRAVRTTGAYRLVRHPIYALELLLTVLAAAARGWASALAFGVVGIALLWPRMLAEEEVLSADPAYQAYRDRVRHRLIPFVL